MNNKLTDERLNDESLEILITTRREIAERHASEGRMGQCAVHTLILNALLELQERRKADSDPVGEFYEDGTLNWYQISDGDRVPANRRIPLYRHAQPAPVVPDYASFEEFWSSFEHPFAEDDELKSFAVEIWNACRAAMLQSKYRDLSQPVDPQISEYEKIMGQAGWVMVPVEPTDEMIAAAMECDDVVFDSKDPTAFCVQYREIYCAMVDVAPQPEGNNR
ncbi:hypothetical protein QRH00_003160 [Salmonella enterica]|nr:hypothetical protein [Salmonella enterica]ELR7740875.1 hypothetical protein [Salmonella enterica]